MQKVSAKFVTQRNPVTLVAANRKELEAKVLQELIANWDYNGDGTCMADYREFVNGHCNADGTDVFLRITTTV